MTARTTHLAVEPISDRSKHVHGSVVTFSVQVGSEGFSIARSVAETLGFHYYDWAITSKTVGPLEAALSGLTGGRGMVDKMLVRLAVANLLEEEVPEGMVGSGSIEMANEAIRRLSDDSLRSAIERIVGQLAAIGGAVIVGHGSQVILQQQPGVFKVLVRASREVRARRLSAAQDMPLQETLAAMADSDRTRASFFRRAYGVDWLDTALYDLVVSTDEVDADVAAEFIAAAAIKMRGLGKREVIGGATPRAMPAPLQRPVAA